jgi:nicotinate-nucleotide adenylyltransferase
MDGVRIGLLGGSFNPPHDAHRAISLLAMKRLRLDAVWWLVSPGNPLKDHDGLAPMTTRMAWAADVARHPKIAISGIEAVIGTQYTEHILSYLRKHRPRTHFVWIMGADNLGQFHRWQNWRHIADLMPMAVIDRGKDGLRAMASPAAQTLARYRIDESDAALLPTMPVPAWIFLHGLKSELSSTKIRAGLPHWTIETVNPK